MLSTNELIANTYTFISSSVVSALPFTLLLVFLVDRLIKEHTFNFSIKVIRIAVLINWGVLLLFWVYNYNAIFWAIDRSYGGYLLLYIFTLFASTVLPVLLFSKSLSKNKWVLFGVIFLSQITIYIEPFIVLVTKIHANGSLERGLYSISSSAIRPIVFACFLLAIDYILIKHRRAKNDAVASINQDILDDT